MQLEVQEQRLPSFWILAVDHRSHLSEISPFVGKTMPQIMAQALSASMEPVSGINMTLAMDRQTQVADYRVGLLIAAPLPTEGIAQVHQVLEHRALVIDLIGAYEGIPLAFQTIRQHAATHGLTLAQPMYYRYMNDPTTTPPHLYHTRVVWAIEG